MRIGGFDTDDRVLLIAEIGNNHEGSAEDAEALVRAAATAGADAVKFQTYRTELFVRPSDSERFERMKRFELAPDAVAELAGIARELGLLFISTPLDLQSVEVLEPHVDAYKIASGDNDFVQLHTAVAAKGRPVILSSGLADLPLLHAAVERVRTGWRAIDADDELAVLQCTSAYPAPPEEANLAAISILADALSCTAGYSDHTLGVDACIAATAAGARVLEKHFTLDKNRSSFRDHQLSADPPELGELVRRVRAVETLLGSAAKERQPSEAPLAQAARRSIVAARDLPAGHRVEAADLGWLRPADGLPPGREGELIGRILVTPVTAGATIRPEHVS